jgi:hypothetical protein
LSILIFRRFDEFYLCDRSCLLARLVYAAFLSFYFTPLTSFRLFSLLFFRSSSFSRIALVLVIFCVHIAADLFVLGLISHARLPQLPCS